MGGSWPAAARLQARPSSSLGRLQQTDKGFRHVWGDGNVQVFTLTFLPAQSAQALVLAINATLDCGEDYPRQDSTRVLPVPKVQGGQVRIIARSHPRGTSGSSTSADGASPNCASALSSIYAVAAAAAVAAAPLSLYAFTVAVTAAATTGATVAAVAAIAATSPTEQLRQSQGQ